MRQQGNAEVGGNILITIFIIFAVLYFLWKCILFILALVAFFTVIYGVCWVIGYFGNKVWNYLDNILNN